MLQLQLINRILQYENVGPEVYFYEFRVGKMAQQVRMVGAKLEDLNLILKIHTV